VETFRRFDARMPLRVKLVATLVVLVAAALAGSGVVATATLRGYLTERVDGQLQSAAHGFVEHGIGRTPGPDGDSRLPSAFVIEVTDSTGAAVFGPTSNLLDSSQPLPQLPRITPAQATARADRPFTVSAVSGSTQWRVLAVPVVLTDGTQGTMLVAQSLGEVQSIVGRLVLLLVVIGLAAVVVLAGVGYMVVRASLKPLREVERTAAAIAAGDLSRRVPDRDPHTEVGRLSTALNGMLHQIESAFRVRAASEAAARRSEEKMRRFVADASHELRTPLTSIRGFAELHRQGAAADPGDVERLMRRIEDEATRMGVLVEDLLLLARLDEQRPLEQAPVDLLTVAADAVHDAGAVQPDRPIDLQVETSEVPPVVLGDEARLRQVLGNLLGNALLHTPAGSPVTVRVATDADRAIAVLEVIDRGPGLSPEDAGRVFERFYRADPSRNRDEGGSGLGLAIVSALVAGHGGRVSVETAPGAGATFRVELPLASAPAHPLPMEPAAPVGA
jgi:two-component system OmpR family sensor kinase